MPHPISNYIEDRVKNQQHFLEARGKGGEGKSSYSLDRLQDFSLRSK